MSPLAPVPLSRRGSGLVSHCRIAPSWSVEQPGPGPWFRSGRDAVAASKGQGWCRCAAGARRVRVPSAALPARARRDQAGSLPWPRPQDLRLVRRLLPSQSGLHRPFGRRRRPRGLTHHATHRTALPRSSLCAVSLSAGAEAEPRPKRGLMPSRPVSDQHRMPTNGRPSRCPEGVRRFFFVGA